MSRKGMTPNEAASALIAAMPTGVTEAQLEEYGIEATGARAQVLTREILSLNLFWIAAAIEAHIPLNFQPVVSELVLHAVESGWGTTYPVGSAVWTTFLAESKERTKRYERLVKEGMSSLAISAEVGMWLEEQHVVGEDERRNVLTLLIDSVPIETYGQLLQDGG
jgi:hypothetical protein